MLAAILLSVLLSATSPVAPPPHGAGCETALLAGLALCLTYTMKKSELDALVVEAEKGDAEAAETLAHFYSEWKQAPEGAWRKWAVLAAERGSCWWINSLHYTAVENGHRAAARKWRTRARWNACKLD